MNSKAQIKRPNKARGKQRSARPPARRLLVLLVLIMGLGAGFKAVSFLTGVQGLGASRPAQAQNADTESGGADTVSQDQAEPGESEGGTEETPPWRGPEEADFAFSDAERDLLESLAARRAELNKRAAELDRREALIKAAEAQLDRKYQELNSLRDQLEALLDEQSEQEEAQLANLVKIYEGMKPKDAARIFNTLDTQVLLSVLKKMSTRRSAPILAEMDPDRARLVTIMLAEQKKLPELPTGPAFQ